MLVCVHLAVVSSVLPSVQYPIPLRECAGVNPAHFAWYPASLVQAVNSGISPLKVGTAVCVRASLDRGVPYPIPNSPPGYDPHCPAPHG